MPFKTPITIKEALAAIHGNAYLLPSIQREVVWDEDRIVRLFDSLMRGYPINSFLFWKVPSANKHDFQFYEFMREYHERDYFHNPKANVDGLGDITSVLDGQQRLTSLYIGLRGTFTTKLRWRRRNDPTAFPSRHLYLNIAAPIPDERQQEYGLLYDFRFLTDQAAAQQGDNHFWFKVGRILDYDSDNPAEIHQFLVQQGLGNHEFAGQCLFRLSQVVNKEPVINYFEEDRPNLERVLDIFVRINSGGVLLSHSDLLLSIATSQWQHLDARETIQGFVDELNQIGDGFDFDKDFVLKASLVLTDLDVAFKVRNFTKANMTKIEMQWNSISAAIRHSVELADAFGFSRATLPSNNALIPIAYYLKAIGVDRSFVTHGKFEIDRRAIRRWLLIALLKRIFSGQSDSVLRAIRVSIKKDYHNGFPSQEIETNLTKSQSRSMRFSEEELEELLYQKYGRGYTFLLLSILYPTLDYRNEFHQDHIHPRSFFTSDSRLSSLGISQEKQKCYVDNCDYIPNLQLLEGPVNQEKQDRDFKEWLDSTYEENEARAEFKKKHYIPDVNLSFANFESFFEARKALILERLKEIFL